MEPVKQTGTVHKRRLVGVEAAAEGGQGAGMGISYQAFAITDSSVPPPVAFELDEADGAE